MKIAETNLADLKGTPYAAVQFFFVNVTPQLAADWLQRNKRNRKIKAVTIETYARDMKNGEWLTTHQGLAFNELGELIDGQNRLHATVRSKVPVLMLVSTGWPVKVAGQKGTTMDAVDMGCGRSLADQLHLQHNTANAKFVAQSAGALVRLICGGFRTAKKQSPSSVLAVAAIYQDEFKWLGEHVSTTHGLKNVGVNAVILLGLAAWPEPTKAFYGQLVSGLNLTATSPIYHLRNWLLTTRAGNSQDEIYKVRQATSYHLKLFVENKTTGSLVATSDAGLVQLRQLNFERVQKIRALFDVMEEPAAKTLPKISPAVIQKAVVRLPGDTLPGNWRQRGAPAASKPAVLAEKVGNSGWQPFCAEAIEMGRRIVGAFTLIDLSVRLDGGSAQISQFIEAWRRRGWIEVVGANLFRKTDKFGGKL